MRLRLLTRRDSGEHARFLGWAARNARDGLKVVAVPGPQPQLEAGSDVTVLECMECEARAGSAPAGPAFDAGAYFAALRLRGVRACGQRLVYAPVLGSTQDVLRDSLPGLEDWNLVLVTDEQRQGKGRGANVWTSPRGCLMFSFQFTHENGSTLAMVQYVIAVAIVKAVKALCAAARCACAVGGGVRALTHNSIAIKWPNDIYGCTLGAQQADWKKVGGILCQSSYWQGRFVVTAGVGLNVTNVEPSICLAQMCSNEVSREQVLAAFMNELEPLMTTFAQWGFDADMRAFYEAHWMHTGQRVLLESQEVVQVEGLTDAGFLRARDEATGVTVELHPDGNSLDWFKGLVKKKF